MSSRSRPGGDGRLTAALDPHDQGPQDACGVFGVWAPGEDVAKLTYFGLYALQHRGQESAGIAVSNGRQILVYKDMGLVSQVFDETTLASLKGHLAIGHARYSTTGRQHLAERAADLPPDRRRLDRARPQRQPDQHPRAAASWSTTCPAPTTSSTCTPGPWSRSTNDTSLVTALLAHHPDTSLEQRALEVLPLLRGRLLLRLDEREHPLRRPRPAGHPPAGARPARPRLGRRLRGRRPGHDRRERRARGRARRDDRHRRERPALAPLRRAGAARAACSSTSTSPGPTPPSRAQRARGPGRDGPPAGPPVPGRGRPGHPVPESGTPAAAGYAEESGIPFGQGFVKNAYVGPHLHPAQPDPAPARHPAQAQRPRAHDPRQADRGGRRLDRARQHPARPGADAPRGGCPRGARAHLVARR